MAISVFFSWQSDRPGRNFIEKALQTAIRDISADIELYEALRADIQLDKDTLNVPGSPAIFETILKKIDRAAIFVADLTFVGKSIDGELLPNPNVLLEYGFALKALGDTRIVAVINTVHGEPSSLPFDLKSKRFPIKYALADDADQQTRTKVREQLSKDLEEALKLILSSPEYKASLPQPPQPPPPQYRQPRDGMARFRPKGEPIGYMRDAMAQARQLKGNPVYLANGTAAWLRLMPQNPVTPWDLGNVKNLTQQLAVSTFYEAPEPPQETRGIDGWGFCRTLRADDAASSVVFLFTDAEIWTINTYYANVQEDVIFVEQNRFVQTLEFFVEFLTRRQVPPPYRWLAGIEGLLDRYLPSQYGVGVGPGPSAAKTVYREGILKQGESAEEALNPFFAELYAAFGTDRTFGRR